MILEVKATKTYNEYVKEHPDLFAEVDGYTWSEDEQKWINTGVTDVTKALIEEWFGLRTVCSDDNFARFFRRKMNVCALRYANLSRIELTAFDPLVANYIERETIENNSKTATSVRNQETSHSDSNTRDSNSTNTDVSESTRTPELTRTETGSDSNTNSDNSSDSGSKTGKVESSGSDTSKDETVHTGTTQADHKDINKVAPQSISYAAASAGNIPNLDWQYATGQAQAGDTGSDSSNDTTNHTGSKADESNSTESNTNTHEGSSSGSSTRNSEAHETGNEKTNGKNTSTQVGHEEGSNSGTGSVDETGNSTENGEGRRRERESGRGGLTPQEALRTAVSYLKTSSAWEWMRRELEGCFLSVYDI